MFIDPPGVAIVRKVRTDRAGLRRQNHVGVENAVFVVGNSGGEARKLNQNPCAGTDLSSLAASGQVPTFIYNAQVQREFGSFVVKTGGSAINTRQLSSSHTR
jgi:hypothetical protein